MRVFPLLAKLWRQLPGQSAVGPSQLYSKLAKRRFARDFFQSVQEDYQLLSPHLPGSLGTFVDIGSGIAALDLFLLLDNPQSRVCLVDRTEVSNSIWYGLEEDGAFYNSLDLAIELLVANGVEADRIQTYEAPEDRILPLATNSVDLVISTLSWGFHYPVSIYLDEVTRVMKPSGTLILEIRKGSDESNQLAPHFTLEPIVQKNGFVRFKCFARR